VNSEVPTWVYTALGVLVTAQFATIGSVIFASWKLVWWLSKIDSRIDEAKATAIRAHKRIDPIEGSIGEGH